MQTLVSKNSFNLFQTFVCKSEMDYYLYNHNSETTLKRNAMKIQKFKIRGTEMNKMQFSEIESYIEDLGLNVNAVFEMIADENEMVYVSNGFVLGLTSTPTEGEWHHFFKKDADGNFMAGKLQFNS